MRCRELRQCIRADLYRHYGRVDAKTFLKSLFLLEGFTYTFWLRLCHYAYTSPFRALFYYPCLLILRHCMHKYGIIISHPTKIAPGLRIIHFGGIVVHGKTTIGKNCSISHGVTIGETRRGEKEGVPTIGDNVYIGPYATTIGRVKIGNNVAIGAHSVVTDDVPDNAVVVGIPARVVSYKGSEGYSLHTDYESPHTA